MKEFKKLIIVAAICFALVSSECYNKCNGHGICDTSNRCVCHKQPGLGLNDKDFNAQMYTGADCSERLCPTGIAFIPIVEDEEYNEVVNVNKNSGSRILLENRDLEGTNDEGDDGTETPTTKATVAPTTQAPTESIDKIIDQLDTLNKTEVDKPIEVFKPKSSDTPSLGGAMKCTKEDQTVYVSVSTQSNTTLVIDKDQDDIQGYDCQVSYVRKDLSLSGELQFNGKANTKWDNGEEMRLYGFQYNTTYDVNVACVYSLETSQVVEESGKVTLLNKGAENVEFTYAKDKKGTYPQFCYLLTIGVNSDSKVVNVDLVSSELAELVGKDSNGFVFGKSIENGAVVTMDAKDININENRRERLLAAEVPDSGHHYVLRLNKKYNKDGNETTTTPETSTTPETTTTTSSSETVRMLEASNSVASADFGGYMKYLQTGNKVFIRVKSKGGSFRIPQTTYLTKDAETCKNYCGTDTTKCGITNIEDPGCFVITLKDKIVINEADDKEAATIYFTLTAVGIHPTYECSGVGRCNRETGQCECLPGYTGDACQILSCPNDCSNHGRCVESSQAIFDGSKTFKGSVPELFGYKKGKKQKIYGCVCDSGYRGPDCSLIECPSSADPSGGSNTEATGEYRDCSGRGICDYSTGNCACFDGFVGTACETIYSNM